MVRLVYSNLGPNHGQYPHRSFFFAVLKLKYFIFAVIFIAAGNYFFTGF
jgi:hypothetical protein